MGSAPMSSLCFEFCQGGHPRVPRSKSISAESVLDDRAIMLSLSKDISLARALRVAPSPMLAQSMSVVVGVKSPPPRSDHSLRLSASTGGECGDAARP